MRSLLPSRLLRLAAFVVPCVLSLAGLLAAGPARAITLLVGPEGVPYKFSDAVAAAKDGDVIDVLPGDYKGETVTLPPVKLTIRGVGQRPVFRAEGRPMLTLRGGALTVENIEFRGARANDASGAGIRLESGRLLVRRCAFFDNEHGIWTGNDEAAQLDIEDSVFGDAPRIEGQLPHLLLVGRIARLRITGSRFHNGYEAHLVKSSARENDIRYNLLADGPGGEASYEVELPLGGMAWLVGNVIEQADGSRHPVVVSYGAEGRHWPQNQLYLSHNTLVNRKWLPAWFVRVFHDRLPADTQLVAVNNLVVGGGVLEWGAKGHFAGNGAALTQMLDAPDSWGFELPIGSWLRGRGVDPRPFGETLVPKAEFTMPVGTRALPPPASWSPGAFQR
ncbi:hypothetical protein ACPOLB_19160 [Rubrivivax sp. RP6-9]|uniref:hypothetical protein n=1 Tax=Rubrivivax sp. RP6-9 TaxID=3415750 RepID=UPI003CC64BAC